MRIPFLITAAIILTACGGGREKYNSSSAKPQSWAMIGFVKADSINPILEPSPGKVFRCPVSGKEVRWEEKNVLNPSAVVKDGRVFLVYRAQDNDMTSRLGLAVSDDGLHFRKENEPVFYPDNDSMKIYEWKGGVEDPRVVVSPDGTYIMTYTAYDGKTARLCLATSKDLLKWEKHGPVLNGSKYRDTWSKSGAIVSMLQGEKVVAVKAGGRYWMYFGDTDLFMAYSDDLLHWTVAEDPESSRMIRVLNPRAGRFDSRLVEPGPFALLKDSGILLIYNGSNAAGFNDPSLPAYAYSAGQALFDNSKPYALKQRLDTSFIHPDKPYEKSGEVNEVCFVEGLVFFKGKWLLYYGTADSRIAVAISSEVF